ncbi:hypothetical protein [Sphingobium ummariense]|uniref:LSU ribosomal protein L21p n=1 Tax=Sphingobium ummariense RL-3 TaxID=1346791 RepID=T0IYH2_9SPHN|nr:hypothetical protein [Sphingobium ummariense]EQB30796.1 hypothetical protein M529_17740 [Sphingobium ummariense RL-3]
MQEFFMDYGLWLLIGLLVVIGAIFLLSGRQKKGESISVESVADAPQFLAGEPAALVTTSPPPPPVEPVSAVSPSPVLPDEAPAAPTAAPEEPVPAPAAEPIPASPSIAAPATEGDDLLRMKGVGPKLKAQLTALGVTSFAQIAAWTDEDIAAVDAKLGNFRGRPVRDQWVDQAKYLAAGDIAGFEAKYGKL